MNERIKAMAERSGLYGVADYDNTISEDVSKVRLDKFADLIVRECINVCDGHARVDGTAQRIIEDIKYHFGVES